MLSVILSLGIKANEESEINNPTLAFMGVEQLCMKPYKSIPDYSDKCKSWLAEESTRIACSKMFMNARGGNFNDFFVDAIDPQCKDGSDCPVTHDNYDEKIVAIEGFCIEAYAQHRDFLEQYFGGETEWPKDHFNCMKFIRCEYIDGVTSSTDATQAQPNTTQPQPNTTQPQPNTTEPQPSNELLFSLEQLRQIWVDNAPSEFHDILSNATVPNPDDVPGYGPNDPEFEYLEMRPYECTKEQIRAQIKGLMVPSNKDVERIFEKKGGIITDYNNNHYTKQMEKFYEKSNLEAIRHINPKDCENYSVNELGECESSSVSNWENASNKDLFCCGIANAIHIKNKYGAKISKGACPPLSIGRGNDNNPPNVERIIRVLDQVTVPFTELQKIGRFDNTSKSYYEAEGALFQQNGTDYVKGFFALHPFAGRFGQLVDNYGTQIANEKAFLRAAASFEDFCGELPDGSIFNDADEACKVLLTVFFAHAIQESGWNTSTTSAKHQGFWHVTEMYYALGGGVDRDTYAENYTQANSTYMYQELPAYGWPVAPGRIYNGRGFHQTTWIYNYIPASSNLFRDPYLLANEPDLLHVSINSMLSAIDYFMMPSTRLSMWQRVHKLDTENQHYNFGATIDTINGGLECTGSGQCQSPQINPGCFNRFDYFLHVAEKLGITGTQFYTKSRRNECKAEEEFLTTLLFKESGEWHVKNYGVGPVSDSGFTVFWRTRDSCKENYAGVNGGCW